MEIPKCVAKADLAVGVGSRGLASVCTDSKMESGQLSMPLTLLSVMIWETGVKSVLLIPLDILEGTKKILD